jgi:putative spermidine/putrescine transport system permease protein
MSKVSDYSEQVIFLVPFVILIATFWLPLLIWLLGLGYGEIRITTFTEAPFFSLVIRTLEFSLIVTVSSLIIAYPLSIVWFILNSTARKTMYILLLFPLLMGLLARNYSWIGMLSAIKVTSSFGLSLLGVSALLYTPLAIILVMSYIFSPLVFYGLTYGLSSVREDQVEAARILGASNFQIVVRLLIPSSYKAAIVVASVVFLLSTGYFVTPAMLGGGKYDFIANLILAISNYGKFKEASDVAIRFVILLLPIYIFAMVYVMHRRNQILGR